MYLNELRCFLPSANPIVTCVAAWLMYKQHIKRFGVVKRYQLWQVKDTRVKQIEVCMCELGYVCVCHLACVPTSMRVTDSVCCSAVKYPEMACL